MLTSTRLSQAPAHHKMDLASKQAGGRFAVNDQAVMPLTAIQPGADDKQSAHHPPMSADTLVAMQQLSQEITEVGGLSHIVSFEAQLTLQAQKPAHGYEFYVRQQHDENPDANTLYLEV